MWHEQCSYSAWVISNFNSLLITSILKKIVSLSIEIMCSFIWGMN